MNTHSPQTVVHLRGDRTVPYERVLQTLSTLQGAGLSQVHFVTQVNATTHAKAHVNRPH